MALQALILPPPQLLAHSPFHSAALASLHASISASNESNKTVTVHVYSLYSGGGTKQSKRYIICYFDV